MTSLVSKIVIIVYCWMLVKNLSFIRAWSTSTAFTATTISENRLFFRQLHPRIHRRGVATSRQTTAAAAASPANSRIQSNTQLHVSTMSNDAVMERNATDTSKASISTRTREEEEEKVYPLEMTDDEKYLFDLNGYLIVRGVLTPEEVEEANTVIDNHSHEMIERSDGALRNAAKGTKMFGHGPGRMDLGQVLEWGEESKVFKSILAHPRLVPIFHGILGKGYRMDHLPLVLAQNKGSEGFSLHGGTIDCVSGEYNPFLAYHCMHGMIRSALLGCNVILVDHNAGDGGFCIVPGSHKSNFKMPNGMVDGEKYAEYVIQPPTKAGDVILFSEGTVHGAQPWTSGRQRRTCLYRFAPATNAYGRSYFGHAMDDNDMNGGGEKRDGTTNWPIKMYEGLTPAQKAVLEPPYANRLDRPNIRIDDKNASGTMSVDMTSRSARKKQHDQDVFGTKYF